MSTLYLIRGAPGSGKTTRAKKMLESQAIDVYFEADMYFTDPYTSEYYFDRTKIKEAHLECQSSTDFAMSEGLNVAVANTFTKRWETQPYYELARKHGYSIREIVCDGRYPNVHGVPEEIVQRMRDNFENYKT